MLVLLRYYWTSWWQILPEMITRLKCYLEALVWCPKSPLHFSIVRLHDIRKDNVKFLRSQKKQSCTFLASVHRKHLLPDMQMLELYHNNAWKAIQKWQSPIVFSIIFHNHEPDLSKTNKIDVKYLAQKTKARQAKYFTTEMCQLFLRYHELKLSNWNCHLKHFERERYAANSKSYAKTAQTSSSVLHNWKQQIFVPA